jgi:hypothetical protein
MDIDKSNISSAVSNALCGIAGAYTHSDAYHIFLVADPASPEPRYEHPVVFVENGSHESWPNSTGRIIDGGGHNGKGPSWLPSSVPVLGSYATPTAGNTPVLHYNGKFGTDGASIVLHRSWCWPHNENWPTANKPNGECSQNDAGIPDSVQQSMFSDLNPYQTFGPVKNNPIYNALEVVGTTKWPQVVKADSGDYYAVPNRQAGDGSSAHPYGGLDVAMSFTPARSTMHLGAGKYPAMLLTKVMILQASGSGVYLGN